MTVYRYTALNRAGHSVTGSLDTQDEHALYTFLKERGLLLQKAGHERRFFKEHKKVRPEDLIEFSHQMSFILDSGVPIIQGLTDIQRSLREGLFKRTLHNVIHDLSSGDSFSQSLSRYPQVFSSAYIAVIHAGEVSGNMGECFKDIARYLEWVLNLKREVKQAMMYPIIVMTIMSLAMVVFVTFVIPKLVAFILELDRPIPIFTKILIVVNGFLLAWWPWLLCLLVGAIFAMAFASRFERCRFLWDQYKLKIPRLGELLRDLALVRFINYMRILYRAGIQVHQSFAILQSVVGNRYFSKKLEQIRNLIMEGESLADAMEKSGDFPPLVERTFRVGERTGSLESALEQLGSFMDRQISMGVKRLTALLEPILLMIIGVMVIFIIVAVLWPVYGILGEIG